MFEKREGRLREERDAARQQAGTAVLERDAVEARVKELNASLEVLSKNLEVRPVK